ncbi:sigma factor [Streptomyces flavofungini]|uniref:sigma factor n=1 Tax=Streptomyces flavofungini TaxID=68200 RepID=UPI0025B2260D|nr:sigma factor [Streptomyces flavofungini]WJV48168.1 sigma factor [Streptomyces flavofungini]
MDEQTGLADRFEAQRGQLRSIAYRMLGSLHEADDAVQETWLRLSRTAARTSERPGPAHGDPDPAAGRPDPAAGRPEPVENLPAWLTTVVSRVCLDMLRTRGTRREDFVGGRVPDHIAAAEAHTPEEEALLIESVGRALLVVLATLGPAERVAFVLHDSFAVPFDRIAAIVERSPTATKKLASRARAKVRGTPDVPDTAPTGHRRAVEAFLAAARGGDIDALLTVLAPDVVRRADPAALPPGAATELHGADAVARETVLLARNARHAAVLLLDGAPGIVVAPRGRLLLALTLTVRSGRITSYEVVSAPSRLRGLTLAVLPE